MLDSHTKTDEHQILSTKNLVQPGVRTGHYPIKRKCDGSNRHKFLPLTGFCDKRLVETGIGNEIRAPQSATIEKPKRASNLSSTYFNYRTYAFQTLYFSQSNLRKPNKGNSYSYTRLLISSFETQVEATTFNLLNIGVTTEVCCEHKRN